MLVYSEVAGDRPSTGLSQACSSQGRPFSRRQLEPEQGDCKSARIGLGAQPTQEALRRATPPIVLPIFGVEARICMILGDARPSGLSQPKHWHFRSDSSTRRSAHHYACMYVWVCNILMEGTGR